MRLKRNVPLECGIIHDKFETSHWQITKTSGTARADVATLRIDTLTGEFKSGLEAYGQTKEQALLARSLSVQQTGCGPMARGMAFGDCTGGGTAS
ncbi:hypothetical protein BGZ65_006901, partial [Modicella reniformis]